MMSNDVEGKVVVITGASSGLAWQSSSGSLTKGEGEHHASRHSGFRVDGRQTRDEILDALSERIFAPDRLNAIMAELRKTVRDSWETGQERVNELSGQVKAAEVRFNRLYEAVEQGLLPLDET